jgi:alpha-L-fucosidase 2
MKKNFLAGLILLTTGTAAFASDLMLWYQQPVGGLTDEPLTSGKGQPPVGMGGGRASHFMDEGLPIGNGRIGGLIAGGTARERIVLNDDSLWLGGANLSGDDGSMGAYQMLGSAFINLPGHVNVTDYRRDLDIGDALAHVSYSVNGVTFSREYFCSHADGVLVVHLAADKPGNYNGTAKCFLKIGD